MAAPPLPNPLAAVILNMKFDTSNVDVPETLVYHWLKSVLSKKLKALKTIDVEGGMLSMEFDTTPDDRSTTSGFV